MLAAPLKAPAVLYRGHYTVSPKLMLAFLGAHGRAVPVESSSDSDSVVLQLAFAAVASSSGSASAASSSSRTC